MKNKLHVAALVLLLFALKIPAHAQPCSIADLVLLKIDEPQWDSENGRTIIKVTVQNIGGARSQPCNLKIFDLDISSKDSSLNLQDSVLIEMLEENESRASYYEYDSFTQIDTNKYDYDFYWELIQEIPALDPSHKTELIFYLDQIWVYNANCEIRAIIDVENTSKDCNRANNILDFFGWG